MTLNVRPRLQNFLFSEDDGWFHTRDCFVALSTSSEDVVGNPTEIYIYLVSEKSNAQDIQYDVRHYRNKQLYTVLGDGIEITGNKYVCYQALYDDEKLGKNRIWVRPYNEFHDEVETEDHKKVKRFEKI